MQSKKSGFVASVPFALLAALLSCLAAFAPPASAAGKTISLSVTPSPAPLSTQTTKVFATIANTGNSNANSFEVDWTASPYFTVTSASAGGTAGSCTPTGLTPGHSGCMFTKQVPTKSSVIITLNVQVTNQCASLSIDWFAYAWTGAPGPASQSFLLPPGPYITASTSSCEIKFVTQPKDAFTGSKITGSPFNSNGSPVSVQLLQNGVATVGTDVSLSASPASCASGTPTATTDSTGTVNLAFTGAAASESCVLTASAPGYGPVDSRAFKVVAHGNLGCTSTDNTFGTTGAGGLALNGTRLPNVDYPSESGADCRPVPYVVSPTCPTGVTGTCTNLTYDPLDQGTRMAFAFHWVWPLEAIPALGIEAIPLTGQLFLNGSTTPLDLDVCREIVPAYGVDGTFTGLAVGSPSPIDQESPTPVGTQAGCLVRRTVQQVGNKIQLIEDAYVQGDYAARRN